MFFTSVEACLAASLTSATALVAASFASETIDVAACLAASTFCAASSFLSKQPVTAKAEPKTNASVNFFIIFSIE